MENTVSALVVKRSVVLIGFSVFVLGLIKTLVDGSRLASLTGTGLMVSVLVFGSAINAFLLWKVYQGRNWARITFVVLFCLGLAPWLLVVSKEFHRSLALWSISMIQAAIQIYAFFLLFTSPGNEWFRSEQTNQP